jgi:hypothetical protein
VDIIYPAVFERCAVSAADGREFSIKVWECGVRNGSSVARAITIEGTPHPAPSSLSLPSEKINIYNDYTKNKNIHGTS